MPGPATVVIRVNWLFLGELLCLYDHLMIYSLEKRGSRIYRPIQDTQAGTKRSFCIHRKLEWYSPPEICKQRKNKCLGLKV